MPTYITHSREETVALGKRAAAVLPAGSLICFTGGLGAGKTAFCEGLAQGLGCIIEALARWRILIYIAFPRRKT